MLAVSHFGTAMGKQKEVTDEQIVIAARAVIEKTARACRLWTSRELGVSYTALFNRFDTKESLMMDIAFERA
jgi:AcrR family transcriptional regulator